MQKKRASRKTLSAGRQIAGAFLSFVTEKHTAWISLFLTLVATQFFIYQLGNFRVSNSIQGWVEQDEPTLMEYRRFLEFFRGFEMIALAVECEDGVFTPESLRRIDAVAKKIQTRADHLKAVYSISNLEALKMTGIMPEMSSPVLEKIPETAEEAAAFRKELMKNRIIRKNLVSSDEKSALIAVFIGGGNQDYSYISRNLDQIESVMSEEAAPGVKFHLAGAHPLNRELNRETKRQAALFGPLAFAIVTIFLAAMLKSLRDLLIVQLCIAISVVWAVGFFVWTGHAINFLTVAMPPLVLVISVADAVHIINRYHEERAAGAAARVAARVAMAETFEPCLFTALTSLVGFGALAVSGIPAIRDFGIYTGAGVALSFLVTILFIPSALASCDGRWERRRADADRGGAIWKFYLSVFEKAMKNRLAVAGVWLLLAVVSLNGISKIKSDTNTKEFFGKNSAIRKDMDFVESRHAGMSSMEFAFPGRPSMMTPQGVGEMMELEKFLEKQPEITGALSIGDYLMEAKRLATGREGELPAEDSPVWKLLRSGRLESLPEVRAYVRDGGVQTRVSARVIYPGAERMRILKRKIEKYLADRPEGGSHVMFTGGSLVYLALSDSVINAQKNSSALAVAIIAAMMALLFRSVPWGLVGMLPNIIPTMMGMAMLGWLDIRLNIATAMIAAISMGLAMDDTMHYMSRCRHEMAKGAGPEEAASIAIRASGRAMITSATSLACGFGVLAFSGFVPIMQFGILTSVTMLTAMITDLFLTPALIMIFRLRTAGKYADV